MDNGIRLMTVTELAEDAFIKAEHVKMLEQMNTPTDYDERKKAFIKLAEAKAASVQANKVLASRTGEPDHG